MAGPAGRREHPQGQPEGPLQPLRHRRPEERRHRLLCRGDHPGAVDLPLVEPLARLPADPLERPLGPRPRPGLAQLPGPHPVLAALRGDGGRRDDAHAERPDRQAGRRPSAPGQVLAVAAENGGRGRRILRRGVRSDRTGLRRRPDEAGRAGPDHGHAAGFEGLSRRQSGPAGPALGWAAPPCRDRRTAVAARQGRPGRPGARARGRRPRPLDPRRMDARPSGSRSPRPKRRRRERSDEMEPRFSRLGGRGALVGRTADGGRSVRCERVRRPPRPSHGEDPRRRGRLPGRHGAHVGPGIQAGT